MSYAVELSRRAAKALKTLDRATLTRLQARIEELAADPVSPRLSNPLIMGTAGQRYSRVGDWRIIYEAREDSRVIFIVSIQPRGKAYRKV